MSKKHRVELTGCTPEPLLSYLKALGILRLVSEQAAPDALGCWDRDLFVLESALDMEGLEGFLLERYRPTPILGPWAGGSGFFGNDNRSAVDAIAASSGDRVSSYRQAIKTVRSILKNEGLGEKPSGDQKAILLRRYRREMPDEFVDWMDAAMALGSESEWYAPILGTGGNDGRLDFTQNFMQRVVDLGFHQPRLRKSSRSLLEACLWGNPTAGLGQSAVGQFSPGRAGGPNATQGLEAGSRDNPWEYLLALEGALMLSSAAVRRLKAGAAGRAAFPFTVASRPVGDIGGSEAEAQDARGELWLPLWGRPSSALELRTLFSEGRAEIGRRPARDAVDFSRAVAGLGTDRGIQSFTRYALLKRSGKSFLAVATERFAVPRSRREATELIGQTDQWLDNLRSRTRSDGPARLQAAVRGIESQIYAYCKHERRKDLLGALMAFGHAERELAVTAGKRGDTTISRPLHTLKKDWVEAVDDSSLEFEIALALASMHDVTRSKTTDALPPIRANLEPVKQNRGRWEWDDAPPSVVWCAGGLVENMNRVLARRILDGVKAGAPRVGLEYRHGVRLTTIARFIAGEVDDRRIEELLWALAMVNVNAAPGFERSKRDQDAPPLPRPFALLKPLFLPWSLGFSRERNRWQYDRQGQVSPIKLEPRLLPLLRAGRTREAFEIACDRLMVSGIPPLRGAKLLDYRADPERLAAALLLPVRNEDLDDLLQLVARPPVMELQGV